MMEVTVAAVTNDNGSHIAPHAARSKWIIHFIIDFMWFRYV